MLVNVPYVLYNVFVNLCLLLCFLIGLTGAIPLLLSGTYGSGGPKLHIPTILFSMLHLINLDLFLGYIYARCDVKPNTAVPESERSHVDGTILMRQKASLLI